MSSGNVKLKNHQLFFLLLSSATYGPVPVVLDMDTYNDIGKYIKYFRPTHGTEFVFTSWLGKQMDSSSVTAALTEELAHGGCTKRYFCIKLQFFNMHHFMLAFLLPQDQFKIWCFCHPQSDHDHAQAHSSHPCVRGPGRRG